VVGGYNSFWVDPGDRVLRVDGQPRSSILIDPPNGRAPGYTPDARERMAAAAAIRKSLGSEYDHPELRPLAEPCITSFGNNLGRRCCPTTLQQLQRRGDEGQRADLTERARHARGGWAARIRRRFRQWFGTRSAVGRRRRDRDHQFHPNYGSAAVENPVTERLTRKDANTLKHRFTVEDPMTFTARHR
jgi:hypothetical protein